MEVLTAILAGVPYTLLLTAAACAIGVVGGVPLALARRSSHIVPRAVARALIELLRGIPPIVWLFFVFFGVGTAFPQLDPLSAAILSLGLISCAYMAEIYRGGLSAIDAGQWEAGAALGMNRTDVLSKIIGPQVFRVSVPASATYAIGLLKDSSAAYTIGVTEVVFYANEQSRATSDAIVPFLFAALVYVVMTIPSAWASRTLDSRLRKRVAR
jgi:polar amino acid transport system permease protein